MNDVVVSAGEYGISDSCCNCNTDDCGADNGKVELNVTGDCSEDNNKVELNDTESCVNDFGEDTEGVDNSLDGIIDDLDAYTETPDVIDTCDRATINVGDEVGDSVGEYGL